MDTHWERTRPYFEVKLAEIVALFRRADINIEVERHRVIHSGLRNTNIYVEGNGNSKFLLRIYVSGDNWWEKEKAIADSIPKEVPRPTLLFVSGPSEWFMCSYAIFEFIDGHTLDLGSRNKKVYAEVGEKLSILHNHRRYDKVGFLDKNLEVQAVLPPLLEWYRNLITETVIEKLGKTRVGELGAFIEKNASLINEMDNCVVFVHNDFRPINIMVDKRDKLFFIDWEGAMAGHLYGDIGQFLRFREQVDTENEKAFIDSYNQNAQIKLDNRYYLMAKIRDLVNYIQLLSGSVKPRMDRDLVHLVNDVVTM